MIGFSYCDPLVESAKVLSLSLECPSSGQNLVKYWTTFCTLVPHHVKQLPFLIVSLLPLKHPESTSVVITFNPDTNCENS